MIIVRYTDDIVVGFEREADAKRFRDDMGRRLAEFAPTLNPEKTRLIEFGRFAADHRARRGLGKPAAFLPKPRIRHPWPSARFAATHPRWEPYALRGDVRICPGARGNSGPYRDRCQRRNGRRNGGLRASP
jgi:hypothetical protein